MTKKKRAETNELLRRFGQRIRDLRISRGIGSQEELGARTGLHRTYIGRVERGETNATLENIAILATALGAPLSELFAPFDGKDGE